MPTSKNLACQKCGQSSIVLTGGTLSSWLFRRPECCCEANTAPEQLPICPRCSSSHHPTVENCPADARSPDVMPADAFIGSCVLERYTLRSSLGVGSWGTVYLAQDLQLKRKVAIKIMHDFLRQDGVSTKLFQREAEISSALTHPNVCTVHDSGLTANGQPFLVMEYLDGESLELVLERERQLSVKRTIQIIAGICDGLGHAHQQGIVHRDLKPANIILLADDFPKLVDFGLARGNRSTASITAIGQTVGTPDFMSPEQWRGDRLDGRADIYALGAIMFYMITGQSLIPTGSLFRSMNFHMSEEPMRPSEARTDLYFQEGLESIVTRCLQKDADQRFSDCRELKEALLYLLPPGSGGIRRAPESTRASEPAKPLWNNSGKSIAAAVVIGGITCAAGLLYVFNDINRSQADSGGSRAVSNQAAPSTEASTAPRTAPAAERLRSGAQKEKAPVSGAAQSPVSVTAAGAIGKIAQQRQNSTNSPLPAKGMTGLPNVVSPPAAVLKPQLANFAAVSEGHLQSPVPQPELTRAQSTAQASTEPANAADGAWLHPARLANATIPVATSSTERNEYAAIMPPQRNESTTPTQSSWTFHVAGIRSDSEAIEKLSTFKGCRVVDIMFSSIGDETVAYLLARFPELQTLRLNQSRVTDKSLLAMGDSEIKNLCIPNTQITDRGLGYLTKAAYLQELNVARCSVTDEGVESISGLPLKALCLRRARISNACASSLAKMSTLQELSLAYTAFDDAGVAKLATLRQLRQLELSNRGVTDAAIFTLAEMPHLEELSLAGTSITDAGLEKLSTSCTHLKRLDISGFVGTPRTIKALAAFPHLKHVRWATGLPPDLEPDLASLNLKRFTQSRLIFSSGCLRGTH